MKTTRTTNWITACAAVLTATAAFRASADQTAAAARPERSYTGTVFSVDPQEHILNAKGFVLSKKFNLGAACAYTLLDNHAGAITDLRPGEKVAVSYQDADGVLVADSVVQQPMRYEGMVQAIDPTAHTLTLHLRGLDKTFQIANDCGVELRGGKSGTLTDIQTGNHVTVTYETPDGALTARQIALTSIEFTGTLTAIDLEEKTLKARALFGSKKFNVADDCAIIINGKTGGQLSDLKTNDKLVFSYDEINGVNVVNRIAPAMEAQPGSVAATSPMTPTTTGY
jgi:Cu/Ag efflux protein CusF